MAKGAQEFRSCQCWSKEHKKELPGNVVMDYSGSEYINVLRGQSVDVALVGVITAWLKLSRIPITWEFPIHTFLIFLVPPSIYLKNFCDRAQKCVKNSVILMSLETPTYSSSLQSRWASKSPGEHIKSNFLSSVSKVSGLLVGEGTWFCISPKHKEYI